MYRFRFRQRGIPRDGTVSVRYTICHTCPAPLRHAVAVVVAVFLTACGAETVAPPSGPPNIDLALPWVTASVAEVGGSDQMVAMGLERARANDRLLSLLAVRNGRLVVEEYFGGSGPDDLHDVRSVTKSVVSTLAGVALARGDIGGLDDPIGDYLGPLVRGVGPEKQAITVGHLLTMTSGLEWDETGGFGSYIEWIRSGDYLNFVLERPIVSPPGTEFNYNSGAVHLLGVVVEQATTMRLPNLAQQALFDPMGISMSRWEPLGGGFHNGGAGLDLRPRDLARFGQLFLQRGSSAGKRIVPVDWVDRSTVERFDWRFDSGSLKGISYGYLWWIVPDAPEPFYFAWGHGGQYIVVVPELNLVIVATSNWRGAGEQAGRYERLTMGMLVEYIVPAFR